jgi:hypothetical protein
MATSQVMLRAMVFSLAGMVLVYFGVGFMLADEWTRETSRTVEAPPQRVAALVEDLGTWPQWSAMDSRMGPETMRKVSGEPGTVGHQVAWSGRQGVATLKFTDVGPDFVQYSYGVEGPEGEKQAWSATGRVSWTAVDGGLRVTWTDRSRWDSFAGRWFAWFGAPQERIGQIQAASLEGLAVELAEPSKPMHQPPPK